MKSTVYTIILTIIISVVFGSLSASFILRGEKLDSEEMLIRDFYLTETAVHVSPHGLRKKMSRGDDSFILVDLRSQEEYEEAHILGAINIPAYKDPDTSAYGDIERIVNDFSKLNKDKDVIVYCYSTPCMTGRKVGKILANEGIYVKHLGIGWNEWRYSWDSWNHEHEWEATAVDEYIVKGTVNIKENNVPDTCSLEGELGC